MTRLPDSAIFALGQEVGCTFGDCENHDVWMVVAGQAQTPAEGMYAFLCSDHVKAMVGLVNDEEREIFARQLNYVVVTGSTFVSLN